MLFRRYAVADVLVLILGQHAFADQVVFVAVRAIGDDFARVARRYSGKCYQIAFAGGIHVHDGVAAAIPAFLHAFGCGLGVFRRGLGHFADFPARFLQRRLGVFRGLGYLFTRLLVAGFLRRGVTSAQLKIAA